MASCNGLTTSSCLPILGTSSLVQPCSNGSWQALGRRSLPFLEATSELESNPRRFAAWCPPVLALKQLLAAPDQLLVGKWYGRTHPATSAARLGRCGFSLQGLGTKIRCYGGPGGWVGGWAENPRHVAIHHAHHGPRHVCVFFFRGVSFWGTLFVKRRSGVESCLDSCAQKWAVLFACRQCAHYFSLPEFLDFVLFGRTGF